MCISVYILIYLYTSMYLFFRSIDPVDEGDEEGDDDEDDDDGNTCA